MFHFHQHFIADIAFSLLRPVYFPSNHQSHNIIHGQIFNISGGDKTAVTKNRCPVSQLHAFLKPVRDIENSRFLRFNQFSDNCIHNVPLIICKCSCRFIQNQYFRFIIYRLCNLNNRLLRNAEFLHQLCRLQIQLEPFQEFCRFLIHILFIQKQSLYGFLTIQKNIFCNRHIQTKRNFLVNNGNPQFF